MALDTTRSQIQAFLVSARADRGLMAALKSDPQAAFLAAGFGSDIASELADELTNAGEVMGYMQSDKCLDPPETDHYSAK